jgi:hypothetical protein
MPVPRDLAALLVEEGAASAEDVERARARQAEVGGALDTALLELGVLGEDRLAPLLAAASGLPAAPERAWAAEDPRARRVFPSRVAERHGLAPFALDGRELALVATVPVDLGLLDEISFMLSLHLTAHVGPEWRVRELIHRLYGSPLPPRLAALAAVAGAGGLPEPAPPQADAVAQEPPAAAEAETWGEPAPMPEEAQPDPAEPPRAPPLSGFTRDDGEPLEPLAAALAQAVEEADPSLWEEEAPPADGAAGARAQGGTGAVSAPPAEGSVEAAPGPEPEPEPGPEPEPEEPAAPPDRSAPPRWTYEEARAALAAARSRDEVVLVALRYARDFFEFASLFAVTRDAVAGHDALGTDDAARELCRGTAIYTDDPGLFRTVIEARSPYLGPVVREASGTDAILGGLARGTPRTVFVYPVLLRDRPVCVVYADNGDAPASPRRLGDLLLLLAGVGAAFERVIRRHKSRAPRRPRPAPGEAWATQEPAPVVPPPAPPPDLGPRERWTAVEPARAAAPEPPAAAAPPAAPAPPAAEAAPRADLDVDVEVDVEEARPEPDPEPEPHPPPSPGALADLALSPDAAIAAAARDALAARRRDPEARQALERLRRALLSGISARTASAARALGAVRDVEAVPLLVQVLETSDPPAAQAAADALADVTLQRLGPDARRWLAWWKENRGRGRADWLFSGLTSPDRQTRIAAAVELAAAAPPPVAYSADMAPSERQEAARAWAGWWARSGQVL